VISHAFSELKPTSSMNPEPTGTLMQISALNITVLSVIDDPENEFDSPDKTWRS
jgi:hypothetical protein